MIDYDAIKKEYEEIMHMPLGILLENDGKPLLKNFQNLRVLLLLVPHLLACNNTDRARLKRLINMARYYKKTNVFKRMFDKLFKRGIYEKRTISE